MPTKLNLEEFQQIAIKNDGRCLSKEYTNCRTKLLFKCNKDKYEWYAIPSHIKRNHWCPKCAGCLKSTLQEFQQIAKERNGECLSTKYINSKTKLLFRCNKDNCEWKTTSSSIKQGTWCPMCNGGIWKNCLEEIQEIAKKKEGECLSTKYINSKTKLLFRCNKDKYEWRMRPNDIKNGHWCPKCVGKNRYTIEEIKEMIKEKGGRCLSIEYINNITPLKIECNRCKNMWLTGFSSILNQKTWCPYCSSSRSEKLCRKYIENKTELKFPKVKPKWLQGLELDGLCKELNLAFEYNGEQHYIQNNYFHKNEQDFLDQLKRDRLKRKLCKIQGIKLITIPHTLNCYKPEKMYKFIDTKLNL